MSGLHIGIAIQNTRVQSVRDHGMVTLTTTPLASWIVIADEFPRPRAAFRDSVGGGRRDVVRQVDRVLIFKNDRLLAGASVLIVEDEILIAMDVEQMLADFGSANALIATEVPEALAAVATQRITIAVLDLSMGRDSSIAVADALAARNIPFVFATAHTGGHMIPAAHTSVPVLEKPIDPDALESVLTRLLDR